MMPRRQRSRSTLRSLSSSSSFGSKRKSRKPIRRERPTKKKQEMMMTMMPPTSNPTAATPTSSTDTSAKSSSTTIKNSSSPRPLPPPPPPPPPPTPTPSFVSDTHKDDKSLHKSPDTCKTVTTVAMTASTTSSLLVPSIDSNATAVSSLPPPRQRTWARRDGSGYFFNPKMTCCADTRAIGSVVGASTGATTPNTSNRKNVTKEQVTGGTTTQGSSKGAIAASGLPPRKHKSIGSAANTRTMRHDQNHQQHRQSGSTSSPPLTFRKCKSFDSCHHPPHRPHAMWTVSEDGEE